MIARHPYTGRPFIEPTVVAAIAPQDPADRTLAESDVQRWARYRRELPQIVASRFPGEEAS